MGTFINLVGRRFERLLVLERVDNLNGRVCFLCQCDCGNKVKVISKSLLNGNTKSCGCYNLDQISKRNLIDLTGEVFGILTVIRRDDDYIDPKSGNHFTMWFCLCKCGNKKKIRGIHLRNGSVVSCGCLSESVIALKLKEYCYKKYGAIIEYKGMRNPKTGRWLFFDIYLPEEKVFIEVHGKQHYQNENHFFKSKEDYEKRKEIDKIKKKFAKKNGIYIEIDLRKIKNIEQAISYVEKVLNKES